LDSGSQTHSGLRRPGEESQRIAELAAVPAHLSSFFHQNVTPYSESNTLSIQRELARDTALIASYVGTQAHHRLVLISANPGNPALCLSLSQPEDVMPGTATCGPLGESGTYVTRSGQTIQGTRGPFTSQFAAVTDCWDHDYRASAPRYAELAEEIATQSNVLKALAEPNVAPATTTG
jgi:hypothetical protein